MKKKWEEMKAAVKRLMAVWLFTQPGPRVSQSLIAIHRGITHKLVLRPGLKIESSDVFLLNLPPSHVGGQTEQLMTTFFMGGKIISMNLFNENQSLEAIEKYKVTCIGQIPALFNYQWDLPNYKDYDLSSLKFALYGGQSVSRQFLEKLSEMAPKFGTGLGLTETSGFCTFTPLDGTVDDILSSVGYAMPITPISIREPMNEDGTAGPEKPKGEPGEICFSGPQILLGYVNDPENTKKTISKDGWCYTGDLGYYDEKGLHFVGRTKLVIKPKGYQVFPTEVENYIQDNMKDKVNAVGVVGVKHEKHSEAIVAYVEKKEGVTLTEDDVKAVTKQMTAYKRPSLIQILEFDEMPLNRVNKTDYVRLKKWRLSKPKNYEKKVNGIKIPLFFHF